MPIGYIVNQLAMVSLTPNLVSMPSASILENLFKEHILFWTTPHNAHLKTQWGTVAYILYMLVWTQSLSVLMDNRAHAEVMVSEIRTSFLPRQFSHTILPSLQNPESTSCVSLPQDLSPWHPTHVHNPLVLDCLSVLFLSKWHRMEWGVYIICHRSESYFIIHAWSVCIHPTVHSNFHCQLSSNPSQWTCNYNDAIMTTSVSINFW